MVIAWQSEPIQINGSGVAGVRPHRDTNLAVHGTARLHHVENNPHDYIWAWRGSNFIFGSNPAMKRGHDCRLNFVVNDGLDFNRLHARCDGNFSSDGARFRRVSECLGKLFRDQEPPIVDVERAGAGLVIIMMSFDDEKDEATL